MNVHGALDHCVGGLRVHDIQQNVDDFIAACAQDRSAENLSGFRIYANLHEPLGLAFFIRTAHPAHRIFRDQSAPPGLPYSCACHTAAAKRRIDVQGIGLNPVGNAPMVCVEEIVGHNLVIVVRSVRESTAAVAVTQGPNAGCAGLQLIVNRDVAALVGRNPGAAETQIAGVRDASNG